MTPAEVDRYTHRRPLQPLDDRYDRYDRYTTVTPPTIQGPGIFSYLLRIYGFTDLPPSLPLLLGTPQTRTIESSYRPARPTAAPRRAATAIMKTSDIFISGAATALKRPHDPYQQDAYVLGC